MIITQTNYTKNTLREVQIILKLLKYTDRDCRAIKKIKENSTKTIDRLEGFNQMIKDKSYIGKIISDVGEEEIVV